MAPPNIPKLTSAEVLERARQVMKEDRFPHLASMDGDQARVRPVSPVRTEGFTVYVANLKMYHKTGEIAANPKVELCYLDEGHNQVRLTGVAEVLTDRQLLQEIWDSNPLMRKYLGSIPLSSSIASRPNRCDICRNGRWNIMNCPLGPFEKRSREIQPGEKSRAGLAWLWRIPGDWIRTAL